MTKEEVLLQEQPTLGERPYVLTYTYLQPPPPFWPVDAVSLIATFGWALCLFGKPGLLYEVSTYTALRSIPQIYWGTLALFIFLIHLAVLSIPALRRYTHNMVLLVVSWWVGVAVLYFIGAGSPFALGGYVHLGIAVGMGLRLWRW